MRKIKENGLDYYLCSFEEESDMMNIFESLGFDLAFRWPCNCDDPVTIEGKKIIDNDSVEEVFKISDALTCLLGINIYPRLYSTKTLGRGLYLSFNMRTHIKKNSKIFGNLDEYINLVYNSKPRFVRLRRE